MLSTEEHGRLKGRGVPAWVRDLVIRRDRELEEARAEIRQLHESLRGDGGSRFSVPNRGANYGGENIPLPSMHDRVVWQGMAGGTPFELELVDVDGEQLRVMCRTWQGVAVYPQVTNVVVIGPGRER